MKVVLTVVTQIGCEYVLQSTKSKTDVQLWIYVYAWEWLEFGIDAIHIVLERLHLGKLFPVPRNVHYSFKKDIYVETNPRDCSVLISF